MSDILQHVDTNTLLAIDLNRALSRLEQKILSVPPTPRLRHSSLERKKTSSNLEYARTLLLRLEHSSTSIKTPSKKQATQGTLHRQRALIKRLTDALQDLSDRDSSSDSSGGEEEEDLLAEYGHPPASSPPPTLSTLSQRNPSPTSTLRNRHHAQPESTAASPTVVSSHQPTLSTNPPAASPTAILEANKATQDHLTASLLSLTQQLKSSSLAFHDSLVLDTETMSRAKEGLDRNATGMEAAGKRMGLLKRMSEGKGWWGRMMLYAWIAGLWMVAILLVFAGPKLRF